MQDYKKVPQLPSGLDLQASILTPDGATGKNWVIVDGVEFRKRPGLRPVLPVPTADDLSAGYGAYLLNPPRGVLAAGQYVIGNQTRTVNYELLEKAAAIDLEVYNETQLVFISDGRLFTVRKIPVMFYTGTTYSVQIGVNASTGQMEATQTTLATGAQVTYTITETSTLQDVATALTGVTLLLDASQYLPTWSTTRLKTLSAGLPASSLLFTDGGWALAPTHSDANLLFAYVTLEMPFSNPTGDDYPYRCFYTQDETNVDGNVQAVQFQDEMMFAGRGDALFSFDGYRMSVAGCNTLNSVSTNGVAGTGDLSTGSYQYYLRPRTVKPSGQVTYGPAYLVEGIGGTNPFSIELTMDFSSDDICMYGSEYSGLAKSPRRMNPLDTTIPVPVISQLTIPTEQREYTQPMVGENLSPDGVSNQRLITSVVGDVVDAGGIAFSSGDATLGEVIDIYRTAANGTTFYYEDTTLARDGHVFTSTMSDASLQTNALYVAKSYVIQRPPDICAAVTAHQNRIVVVGEYSDDYTDFSGPVTSLASNRPFIKNVYWSQPNNEEFNPLNNVILDVTEGGELNSVLSVNDALYVGGNESLWMLQGTLSSSSSFTVNRIAGAAGTVGNTAIAALNGQVFAVSRNGLYSLNGSSADYTAGAPVNSLIRAVSEELLPFIRLQSIRDNAGLLLIIPGIVLERTSTSAADPLSLPGSFVATEIASDTVALHFDPNTNQWALWSGDEMYMGGGVVDFDGKLWAFPRRDEKHISVLDSNWGYDGFDTPVEMRIEGPWQTDGDIFTDKSFVRFRVMSLAGGRQNFVLTTKIERNFVEDVAWQTVDIGFRSGAGYGQLPYGQYPYGDPNETSQQVALTNQKALSVRAVIENSDPAEFPSITAWSFEVGENRKNMKQE